MLVYVCHLFLSVVHKDSGTLHIKQSFEAQLDHDYECTKYIKLQVTMATILRVVDSLNSTYSNIS